jgi:hypothetical protein
VTELANLQSSGKHASHYTTEDDYCVYNNHKESANSNFPCTAYCCIPLHSLNTKRMLSPWMRVFHCSKNNIQKLIKRCKCT